MKQYFLDMKIKQSETIIIKRSQIKFADYNPRKESKKVIEALRKNFKTVGFLGGIVWNEQTGNLVGGHKRVQTLDIIFDYPNNDYDIKVEKINVDEKTEKEQNIFLNNKRVQGETDYELLSKLLPDIDKDVAGLDDYDIDLVKSIVPDFNFGSNDIIKQEIESLKPEKKENIKNLKKELKKEISKNQQDFYFVVTFKSYDDKAEFLESIGISGDDIYLTSEKFLTKLNEQ